VRELRYDVTRRGFRSRQITLVTGSVASFHLGRIWSMIPLCDDSG
jgi:hypothetical protein